jgi:hypothetical protein
MERMLNRRTVGLVVASGVATAGLLSTAGPVAAATPAKHTQVQAKPKKDKKPCKRPQVKRSGHWVQYCPMWRGNVPVYKDANHGKHGKVVGHLRAGGSANWFVGDRYRSKYTLGRYYNHWWAYTKADNGKWGWVSEVYFAGGGNDVTDSGLYVCNSHAAPHKNKC